MNSMALSLALVILPFFIGNSGPANPEKISATS